jgi:carboxyl-terminal processing protease
VSIALFVGVSLSKNEVERKVVMAKEKLRGTMKRLIVIIINALLLFFITSGAFGAGVLYGRSGASFNPTVAQAKDRPPEFDLFWQVWNLAHRHFVDQDALEPTRLTYGAINGLIGALGDEGHTRFLTPEEVAHHQTDNAGGYDGVGMQVGIEDDLPVVIA